MLKRELRKNEHNDKESIHIITDYVINNAGDTAIICTDILKNYIIDRKSANFVDLNTSSLTSADLLMQTDYIDNKIVMKLSIRGPKTYEIVTEVDEEALCYALVNAAKNEQSLSSLPIIAKLRSDLYNKMTVQLLNEEDLLLSSSNPLIAYCEAYDADDNLIGTASRISIGISVNNLSILLCEYVGDQEYPDYSSIKFYIGDKVISANSCELEDSSISSKAKLGYVEVKTYRTDFNVEEHNDNSNVLKAEKAAAIIKKKDIININEALDVPIDAILEMNNNRALVKYFKEMKTKNKSNYIDIDVYLLEE